MIHSWFYQTVGRRFGSFQGCIRGILYPIGLIFELEGQNPRV